MFWISASFRTTELWPSAPICGRKRCRATSSSAPEKANIPVYKPPLACTYIFVYTEEENVSSLRPEEVVPSAPLQFNSFLASGTEKATQCVCPLAPLTELATHLTWALHVGGAAHTESEPNPVERTWARDGAWATEIKCLVTSSLVWSLRPSANSTWTQGLVSQLWEGRGQVYPTALLP